MNEPQTREVLYVVDRALYERVVRLESERQWAVVVAAVLGVALIAAIVAGYLAVAELRGQLDMLYEYLRITDSV